MALFCDGVGGSSLPPSPLKACTKCGTLKPHTNDHFQFLSKKTRQLNSQCRECRNADRRSRYWAAPDEERAAQRARRIDNAEAAAALNAKFYAKHRERLTRRMRARWASIRAEALAQYGGQCACCGEQEDAFLALDHARRDGNAHRARVGGQAGVYRDLKRRGWPTDGYRLLCHNCNMATRFGAICPHQKR